MVSKEFAPLGGRLITKTTIIAAILALVAVVLLAKRFVYGLGAVTNISNGYPWGIWVAYDVVVGTAFACGGYAMALLVYIANRGHYHPLVRPALLASAFGYSLGGVSVLFDLGRYWNFWHIMWPGYAQVNSVMFEVALCVSAYVCVLWIEFTPTFLDRFHIPNLKHKLNRVLFVFIAAGILLPTMHQSSLGTLLVIMGPIVHPLWQTPILPFLFLVSSLAMGYSIVIFEASLASAGFRRPFEAPLLAKMSRIIAVLLAVFLVVRFGDLAVQGKLGAMFTSGFKSFMFWVEMALYAAPLAILVTCPNRKKPRSLFVAAVSMLLAGAIYRLDAFLVAYDRGANWHYFPSVSEVLVTVGIIAIEVLGYVLIVKTFPVLHSNELADELAHAAE